MVVDTLANSSDRVADVLNKATEIGENAVEKGRESARVLADTGLDYVGDVTERVSGFVKRDPWVAVAGAFVIGYVVAHLFRQMK